MVGVDENIWFLQMTVEELGCFVYLSCSVIKVRINEEKLVTGRSFSSMTMCLAIDFKLLQLFFWVMKVMWKNLCASYQSSVCYISPSVLQNPCCSRK